MRGLAQELAQSATDLNVPHKFFSDYARRLLKLAKLSREAQELNSQLSYNQDPRLHALLQMLKSQNLFKSGQRNLFLEMEVSFKSYFYRTEQFDLVEKLVESLELGKNLAYLESLSVNESDLFEKFSHEIDESSQNCLDSYRWFVVFSSRLPFLSLHPKDRAQNTFIFNTGFSQYTGVIDALELWRTQETQTQFFQIAGDGPTKHYYSPLAMTSLYPMIIALPYPYSLNVSDMNKTFPSQNANIFPIGFPLLTAMIDGTRMTPHQTYIHDIHHAAILRAAIHSFGSRSLLSDEETSKVQELMMKGTIAFSKAIVELDQAIDEMPQETDTEKRKRSEFEYFLFTIAHEDRMHLFSRISRLISPMYHPMEPLSHALSYLKSFLYKDDNSPVTSVEEAHKAIKDDTIEWINFIRDHLSEEVFKDLWEFRREWEDKSMASSNDKLIAPLFGGIYSVQESEDSYSIRKSYIDRIDRCFQWNRKDENLYLHIFNPNKVSHTFTYSVKK
jgi:hypothetical protein